ncbi:MAG: hypothetical protein FJW50_01585 [Actinobacteria bacterium]|nr:hypothetical protein [Actinomycetota bacterium]
MKRALITLVSVIVGVGIVVGVGYVAFVASEEPAVIVAKPNGTMQTPKGELPHAVLDLSVYPNSSKDVPAPKTANAIQANWLSGQPFYGPSTSIQVPANSVVTINFTQYDGGGTIYNDFFARVHGSMDGTISWNGKSVKSIPQDQMAHTFTVHQYPESTQPYFFLSVPLPQNPPDAKTNKAGFAEQPQQISVTFITGEAGTYIWNCEFPCGDLYQEFGGPMQTRGWMAGTFEVV